MIILRKLFSLQEEIDWLRKMHPNWSESQINAKLNFSSKADKYISKMGNKSSQIKPKVTKFIKHPVYFSDTTDNLQQRNFGLIGKLAARRVGQLKTQQQNLINTLSQPKVIKSPEERRLTGKLLKQAKNNGIEVINFTPGSANAFRPEFLTSDQRNKLTQAVNSGVYLSQQELKPINAILQGKKIISVHGKKSSAAQIAHELGHNTGDTVKGNLFYEAKYPKVYADNFNNVSSNGISGLSSTSKEIVKKQMKPLKPNYNSAEIKKAMAKRIGNIGKEPKRESDSRFKALKMSLDNWKGYGPRVREEARATKNGLGFIKDFGASPGLQKESKQELGGALNTYKLQRKISVLEPIARYADKSVIGDVSGNINRQLSQNTSNAINTVYGRGGRF